MTDVDRGITTRADRRPETDGPAASPPGRPATDRQMTGGEGQMVGERAMMDRTVAARPTAATMAARIVALVFGLIQLTIGLRIAFLALDAQRDNALVAGILDLSQPLVAPFEGIFQTNAIQTGGSILDVAAIAALIGWTIVEVIIIAVLRLRRPGTEV